MKYIFTFLLILTLSIICAIMLLILIILHLIWHFAITKEIEDLYNDLIEIPKRAYNSFLQINKK